MSAKYQSPRDIHKFAMRMIRDDDSSYQIVDYVIKSMKSWHRGVLKKRAEYNLEPQIKRAKKAV